MMTKESTTGFILIKLVTTLILIRVIGAFAGLFLYTDVNGFLASKRNSEVALKTQVALDRISAELRNIKASPKPVFETRKITYQNDIGTVNRILQIEDGPQGPGIYLTVLGGAKNLLLDDVNVANRTSPTWLLKTLTTKTTTTKSAPSGSRSE